MEVVKAGRVEPHGFDGRFQPQVPFSFVKTLSLSGHTSGSPRSGDFLQ